MPSDKGSLWVVERLGRFEDFMVGPLAWEDPARASAKLAMRHASYGEERNLICWDPRGSCLARVADWAKEEHWGERVLVVSELAPNALGLSWERRQTDLWEIGAAWQGFEASAALRAMPAADREKLCAHIKSWFAAETLARELNAGGVAKATGPRARL